MNKLSLLNEQTDFAEFKSPDPASLSDFDPAKVNVASSGSGSEVMVDRPVRSLIEATLAEKDEDWTLV